MATKIHEPSYFETTTTDATVTVAGRIYISANGAGLLKARVVAIDTATGKTIGGEKYAFYQMISSSLALAGSVTDIIAVYINDAANNTGATFTIDVSGSYIRVKVTGNAGRTIRWRVKMDIHSVE